MVTLSLVVHHLFLEVRQVDSVTAFDIISYFSRLKLSLKIDKAFLIFKREPYVS